MSISIIFLMIFSFFCFMFLLLIGMPVAFSLGLASLLTFIIERGIFDVTFAMISQRMTYGLFTFPVLCVPFFLLAGRVMNEGGVTTRIFRFACLVTRPIRGGLGYANVVASMIFAGISGSAVADASGLGRIEIKAMQDAGYKLDDSVAITGASSVIGPIIPPSIGMVLYGSLASVSIGGLFIGGIVPGILLGIGLMITWGFLTKKENYPKEKMASLKEIVSEFYRDFLPLMAPVILVGGIWTGTFTPTEAGAATVAYSIILACFVYRSISIGKLLEIFRDTMIDTAIIMFIFSCASFFGWTIIRYRFPFFIAESITTLTSNPNIVYLLILGLVGILGCFMSASVVIVIFTPILLPLISKVGIDPLHFGVILNIAIAIGVITPPYGICLFALVRIANISFSRLVKASLPYILVLFAITILCTFVPSIVTYLPKLWLATR